jgi:hypothetical protein
VDTADSSPNVSEPPCTGVPTISGLFRSADGNRAEAAAEVLAATLVCDVSFDEELLHDAATSMATANTSAPGKAERRGFSVDIESLPEWIARMIR